MKESEFVDFTRAALISFWAAVFSKACAFSTLSNAITTKRAGGSPSRLVNFWLREMTAGSRHFSCGRTRFIDDAGLVSVSVVYFQNGNDDVGRRLSLGVKSLDRRSSDGSTSDKRLLACNSFS